MSRLPTARSQLPLGCLTIYIDEYGLDSIGGDSVKGDLGGGVIGTRSIDLPFKAQMKWLREHEMAELATALENLERKRRQTTAGTEDKQP